MIYFIIFVFITPALSQYMAAGLKPDVTFGDHNDRFDVSNFLRQQKHYFKDNFQDTQSEEYRRRSRKINRGRSIELRDKYDTGRNLDGIELLSLLTHTDGKKGRKSMKKKIIKKMEAHVNDLANTIITKMRSMRKFGDDFAYHDKMESGGGDVDDYNENLKKFGRLQNFREDDTVLSSRRLQDVVDKLHGSKATRRMMSDPEKEILLHYAFPLDVKIEGFLQTPIVDTA